MASSTDDGASTAAKVFGGILLGFFVGLAVAYWQADRADDHVTEADRLTAWDEGFDAGKAARAGEYDRGYEAGILWQLDFSAEVGDCISRNNASWREHYGPNAEMNDATAEGIGRSCQKYAIEQVGEPVSYPD